jgi:DNA invertase Pin-like site-specific DNA recombinase
VTVLDHHVSTKGKMGQVVLTVLGMTAQMEKRFITERQREGIARAKADGLHGRQAPPGSRPHQVARRRRHVRHRDRPAARLLEDAGVPGAGGVAVDIRFAHIAEAGGYGGESWKLAFRLAASYDFRRFSNAQSSSVTLISRRWAQRRGGANE